MLRCTCWKMFKIVKRSKDKAIFNWYGIHLLSYLLTHLLIKGKNSLIEFCSGQETAYPAMCYNDLMKQVITYFYIASFIPYSLTHLLTHSLSYIRQLTIGS